MKSLFRIMSVAVAAALTLGSCHKDNPNYSQGQVGAEENIGYLSLSALEASIMVDTENIVSPSTTRADIDINTFDVVITNESGAVVNEFVYGNLPSEPIALPAGVYTLRMSSSEMVGAAWEAPVYSGEKSFVVVRKQVTELEELICKLANIKVTVSYAADLKDELDPDYTTMVATIAENELVYALNEERAGYFEAVAKENTLNLTLSCRYKGQDKDIIMTSSIDGVKAAQWRKINVVVQHALEGDLTLGIVCDTWTYDEVVEFDSAAYLMEDILTDDTDMPVIVWEGHDLADKFQLNDDMFDAEGNFTKSINIDITAKSPIRSLVVKVSSDNSDFTKAYSEIMPLEEDLCNPTVSNAILKMMGYPTDAAGATATRIKFASQTDLLTACEGTHSYEITVVDENGGETTATLAIEYGENVAPKIVWVGYDITKRQTITSETTCRIEVTAPLGIKDFLVEIISDTLTPEELGVVGLTDKFSLVNPGEYEDKLDGLGFPIKGEENVYGKTYIAGEELDITSFLSLLGMLGNGDHDFKMTVVDMEDNVTTEVVMMHFE